MQEMNGSAGEMGLDALESADEFELLDASESAWPADDEGEAVFDEIEEMELAAALLEVQDEAELEEFLGKLIKRAGRAAGKFVRSPIGKALGGALKKVARTALPIAGAALGNLALPGVGGVIGGKLASAAGRMFGLELEGMSVQDQEFEIARRFVRLSGDAARRAALMPSQGPPPKIAKDAILAAATKHAPGLLGRSVRPRRQAGYGSAQSARGRADRGHRIARGEPMAHRGTWVRRGGSIVMSLD